MQSHADVMELDLVGDEDRPEYRLITRSGYCLGAFTGMRLPTPKKEPPIPAPVFVGRNDDTGEEIARGTEAEVRAAVRRHLEEHGPCWVVIGPDVTPTDTPELVIRGHLRVLPE